MLFNFSTFFSLFYQFTWNLPISSWWEKKRKMSPKYKTTDLQTKMYNKDYDYFVNEWIFKFQFEIRITDALCSRISEVKPNGIAAHNSNCTYLLLHFCCCCCCCCYVVIGKAHLQSALAGWGNFILFQPSWHTHFAYRFKISFA